MLRKAVFVFSLVVVLLTYIALVLDRHILIILVGSPSFNLRIILELILVFDEFLVDTKPRAFLLLDVFDLLFTFLIVTIVSDGALPWLWWLLLSSIVILRLILLYCYYLFMK